MPRRFSIFAVSLSLVLLALPAHAQKAGKAPAKPLPPPEKLGVRLGTVQVAPPPGLALFNKALVETQAGHYAEAERLYKQLLKMEPDAAAAWANLGLIVGRQDRITEATNYIEKAVRLSPETGAFWAQLSAYQLRGQKWDAARQSAQKALSLEPQNLLALATVGDTYFAQKRYKEAVPVLRKLRTLEGSNPTDHTEITLTLALAGSGKASEAVAIAQKRSARLPKDTNSQLLLGDMARRAGNIAVAQSAYKKAAALNPNSPGVLAGLSLTAAAQGDRATALKLVNTRLASDPRNPVLHFQKGYLIYTDTTRPNDERFGEAASAFHQAAVLDPKNALYRAYTGVALMMQGPFPGLRKDEQPPQDTPPFAAAEVMLQGALAIAPHDTLSRLTLASIAERRNQLDNAIAQYRAILVYAPNDRDALRGIAGVLYAQGKKTEAYQQMEEIARRLPKDTQALSELASWYIEDKRVDDARLAYKRVLQRNDRDVPARIALARTFEVDKKPTEAIAQYEAALAADPKSRDSALLLGSLLVEQKKVDEGIAVFRQFLDRVPDDNLVRYQLAQTLRDAKRYDEALPELQNLTLRKDDPNRSIYLLSAPRLLIEQKKYDEAARRLLQLSSEEPNNDEVRYLLADVYEKAGQPEKGEAILLEILNRPPDPTGKPAPLPARPRLLLAEMYERAQKWDDAAAQYEEVLRLNAMQTNALFALQRVREKQAKPDAAAQFLEGLALAGDKEPNLPAVGGVHQLYQENKSWDKWRAFTAQVLAKYPDNRNAIYLRARSLTEQAPDENARREAIALYEKIIKKDANDTEAQRNLARELEALGRKAEATAAYKALLKSQPTDTDAATALQRLGAK